MGLFDTPASIRTDVLFRAGEATNNTSGRYYTRVIDYMDQAHRELCQGCNLLNPKANVVFKWALKHPPGVLRLEPKYDTGTASATQGSSTVTFSAVIAQSVQGWHLKFDGWDDVFRVTAHTAGTATCTIDLEFTGQSITAGTYKLMKLEYTIGSNDILRLVSPFRVFKQSNYTNDLKIYGVEPETFDSRFSLTNIQPGMPEAFKVVKISENNVTILFNRYLETDYAKVEYDFVQKPVALTAAGVSTDILIPDSHRGVLADMTLLMVLKDKSDDKHDDIAAKAKSRFEAMVTATKQEINLIDESFGQFVHREDDFGYDDRLLKTASGFIVGFVY